MKNEQSFKEYNITKDIQETTRFYFELTKMEDLDERKKDPNYLEKLKERLGKIEIRTLHQCITYNDTGEILYLTHHDWGDWVDRESIDEVHRTFKAMLKPQFTDDSITFISSNELWLRGNISIISDGLFVVPYELNINYSEFALFVRLKNGERLLAAYGHFKESI